MEEIGKIELKTLSIAKVFTTEKKHKTTIDISRKGSIIKEKCKQLTEIVLSLYPDRRVPDDDLDYLISRYVGADRETRRAYKGYYGRIRRSKRTGEGYVIGSSRKGYLEIFGFMHRINNNKWFIHAQMKLPEAQMVSNVDESADLSLSTNEGLAKVVSKDKISLCVTEKIENKLNNNTTERERNFTPKIPQRFSLSREELAILNAKSCQEPDGAKIEWEADPDERGRAETTC